MESLPPQMSDELEEASPFDDDELGEDGFEDEGLGDVEPLLTPEEANALSDAMQMADASIAPPRRTELGSAEAALRAQLGDADVVVLGLAEAAGAALLRATQHPHKVRSNTPSILGFESLPVEPEVVRLPIVDGESLVGYVLVDARLGEHLVGAALGQPIEVPDPEARDEEGDEDDQDAEPPSFTDIDRRLIGAFLKGLVPTVERGLMRRAEPLGLGRDDTRIKDRPARFEPLLRLGLSIALPQGGATELAFALRASAFGAVERAVDKAVPHPGPEQIRGTAVELAIVLGQASSTVARVLDWKEGDVVRLQTSQDAPLCGRVGQVEVVRGNPVVHRGNLALVITDVVGGRAA